jgi:hypothetical protein
MAAGNWLKDLGFIESQKGKTIQIINWQTMRT